MNNKVYIICMLDCEIRKNILHFLECKIKNEKGSHFNFDTFRDTLQLWFTLNGNSSQQTVFFALFKKLN